MFPGGNILILKSRFAFSVSALLLTMGFAPAGKAEEKAYTSHIGAIAEYHDLHFVELDNEGEAINEEKGNLLFSGGGFNWQLPNGLFGEAFFKQAEDTLSYSGYTQFGQFVTTNTEYYISDLSVIFGRDFGPTSTFLGVNRHYRERNILSVPAKRVGGLYEELDTLNGVFGVRAALFRHNPFQLRLEARIAMGIDSSLYSNDGNWDPVTISPGKQMSYRIAAELFYNAFSGVVISLIPAYEYTSIDKSHQYPVYRDGISLGFNAYHPATEWESYSLTGKLSWYF